MSELNMEFIEEEINFEDTVDEVNFADDAEEVTFVPDNKVIVTVAADKLNLRRYPKNESIVVTVLDKGTELEVDTNVSIPEWTKVVTKDGRIEGYVMSKFVQ